MSPRHTRRQFLSRAAAAGLMLPAVTRHALAQSAPTTALARFLFLDDAFVESGRGFERIFHRPKKAGLIQESDGQPWQLGDQTSVVRDPGGRFHMTYRVAHSTAAESTPLRPGNTGAVS